MDAASVARRHFLRGSLQRAAGLAAWRLLPAVSAVEFAFAAAPQDSGFRFVWVSDTHLHPRGINTRFVERAMQAFREIGTMQPAPDFLVFGGDLAHMGDAAELQLGAELLREANVRQVFIPGEHDWYLDLGDTWNRLFGPAPWSFDHKGVRFVGLDTVSHAEEFWRPRGLGARERMARMAVLDDALAGAWAALGTAQLVWVDRLLADWPRERPLVLFSHNPLYDLYAPWNFRVRDWASLHEVLRPFAQVTNIHGHCHRRLEHRQGKLRFIGMPATSWSWPQVPNAGRSDGAAAATGWCELRWDGMGMTAGSHEWHG